MTIAEAQRDLQRAFVGGGPGVFISGIVWIAAAGVEQAAGTGAAFAVLFFGGMLIFPLATLVCRFLFGAEKEASGNPFGATALESTVAMIGGLFAACYSCRSSRTTCSRSPQLLSGPIMRSSGLSMATLFSWFWGR